MAKPDEECYSKSYLELIKFESNDPSEQADSNRKLLLLTCEESSKTLDNISTSIIYEENIKNYTKTTSCGKIFEDKLSTIKNPPKWSSNLRNNKALSQLIKTSLVQSKNLENDFLAISDVFKTKSDYIPLLKSNINTKYVNPKLNISTIFTNTSESAFKYNLDLPRNVPNFNVTKNNCINENELKSDGYNRNLNVENNASNFAPKQNSLQPVPHFQHNIQLKQITPLNPEYANSSKPMESGEINKNKFSFNKYQGRCDDRNKKQNYSISEDDNESKFKWKKTDGRSYSDRFKALKGIEDDDDGSEDCRNPYFKKKKSVNLYSKRFKRHEENDDDEEEEAPKKFGAFKTAREELNIQHIKKHGTSAPLMNSSKRKRLGLRGPGSKFISPLINRNESSGDDSSKSQECPEQILDERLKNIDPKMVDLIKSEIMEFGPKIDWNDIAGLQFAKTAIQEAVVWPMLRPDIFTGLRRPPKGILLFGPPGTGKTLIGKCVASQSQSTFFSISASSLTSKWIGDGEKMVRALFAVARCHQPAVIFIDEIDSLLSQRSDSEHESSRRIKTEFLVQLDGAATDNEERLLLIGATNRPQELDEAARRRFVKRLYIPLPESEARLQLVQRLMSSEKHSLAENNIQEIATLSEGYSGADMRNLCADACMGPIRSIDISQIQNIQAQEVRPVSMADFTKSLSRVRPSVSSKDLDQYIKWDKTYGSGAF